jgi:hypothetical protein
MCKRPWARASIIPLALGALMVLTAFRAIRVAMSIPAGEGSIGALGLLVFALPALGLGFLLLAYAAARRAGAPWASGRAGLTHGAVLVAGLYVTWVLLAVLRGQ